MLARKQFLLALSSTLAQEGYEACQKAMHGSSRGGQSDRERTARNRRRDKRLVKETTPAHFASRGWIRREDCRDGAAHKTIAVVTSSNITSSNRRCAVGKKRRRREMRRGSSAGVGPQNDHYLVAPSGFGRKHDVARLDAQR